MSDKLIFKVTEYRGRKEGLQFPYLREKGVSVDINSLAKHNNLNGVEWFSATIKNIQPKNGNKPFDVLEIVEVFVADTQPKFVSYYATSGMVTYSFEKVDYEIDYYRKGGIKSSDFNGVVVKQDTIHIKEVLPMTGLSEEMITDFRIDYEKSHDKFSSISVYDLISVSEEGFTFNANKEHYINGEIRETVFVPKQYITGVRGDNSNGNISFSIMREELKELLNTDNLYTGYMYYRTELGAVSSSWFSVSLCKTTEITDSNKIQLVEGESVTINTTANVTTYAYKFANDDTVSYYRRIEWEGREYNTIFSETIVNTLLEKFFFLTVSRGFSYSTSVVRDLRKVNKNAAIMLQLIQLRKEDSCRMYDIISLAKELDVTVEELAEVMIIITEKFFPEIESHDFNEVKGKFLTKDDNYLAFHYPRVVNGYTTGGKETVGFDLPEDSVNFKFFPRILKRNPFTMEKLHYWGGDTEHLRWGSITTERRCEVSKLTANDFEHLEVADEEDLKTKFESLYNKLDDFWNEVPSFESISMFNNIVNHFQVKYSDLTSEVFELMTKYHVERKSSGGGYGFWIPD